MLIKKIISVFIMLLAFPIVCYAAEPSVQAEPSVSAKCVVLMCAQTGEILYGKNMNQRQSMASTTKIMTALIALEEGCPEKVVKASKEMISVEGTSMGLLEGDSVTLRTLVYGMLLASGNDAANATACTVAGSSKKFAELMNERAAEIGMKNTHFVTPSGLDNKEHYSTAYDMALLACEAIKNVEFRAICSSTSSKVYYGNPPYQRTVVNHNRLLYTYDGCIGVKTGFTKKSGRCLVSAAERDGVTLVAVTLKDPNDWKDHVKLLNYGFSLVKKAELDEDLSGVKLKVVGGKKSASSVKCAFETSTVCSVSDEAEITRVVLIKHFEYAPVSEGNVAGSVRYYSGEMLLCEVPIVVCQSVDAVNPEKQENDNDESKSFWDNIIEKIKDFFRRG